MIIDYNVLSFILTNFNNELLRYCPKAHLSLEVLRTTGIRISEIDAVYWQVLITNKFVLTCPKTQTVRTFQPSELLQEFKDYVVSGDYSNILIFKSSIYHYLDLFHLPNFMISGQHLTRAHIYRYYYCRYLLYEVGLTPLQIQAKMSHSDINQTNQYLYLPIDMI